MEFLTIVPFFIPIALVAGLILLHPMKVIQMVVPWIVVVASVLIFALGWEWERKGNVILHDYVNDSDFKVIGHAISDFGNVLECIGTLGALVGLALFGAL